MGTLIRGALTIMTICAGMISAQNKPTIGVMPVDTVIKGLGPDVLVVPNVDDGDPGATQTLSITATSSDPSILIVDSVRYTSGQRCGFVYVHENGVAGSVSVSVKVDDPDGSTTASATVNVTPYNNPGVRFEAHDAIFWQEVVPLRGTPVYSRTLPEARILLENLDFSKIPITVNQECVEIPPCTGNDFFTEFYKGFLTVPQTGTYRFFMEGHDSRALWICPQASFGAPRQIISKSIRTESLPIGTDIGGNLIQSDTMTLIAGKTYGMFATNWVIHYVNSGILWEGPGITRSYIPGSSLMPAYASVKPRIPRNLRVLSKSDRTIRIAWSKSSDTTSATGFNVYLDGVKTASLAETTHTVQGLDAGSEHSLFIVAVDEMRNESYPTPVLDVKTFGLDTTPPSPPTAIVAGTISDLAVRVRWSGAADAQTAVASYNIFVDGAKVNTQPCYEDSFTVIRLIPLTTYKIEVEAVDGGNNVSVKSAPFSFTTIAFNPVSPDLGMRKGAVTFTPSAIGNATGFGLNTGYGNAEYLEPDIRGLVDEFKPSLLRWGTLGANGMNFSDYSGPGKKDTYAKFLKHCNDRKIACELTTGVADATDWRTNPQTFANFIEYLNGPSTSTYGALRAAEGFTTPLLAGSKGLIIELGCEVWGGAGLHNAEIGADYPAYGAWCRSVAKIMKASPWYDTAKIKLAYSGRNPSPLDSYGLNSSVIKGDTGDVEMMTVAGYLGGNMNYDPAIAPGKSEGDYYKDGFQLVKRNLDGMKSQKTQEKTSTGFYKPTYFYESNMTTPSYNGRLGQAVTMTGYMAAAMENGSVYPSVFHLDGGEWKIVRKEENYRKLPLFKISSLYNRLCQGGVALQGSIQTLGSLISSTKTKVALEPVGYHLYANGANYALLLASRDFDNEYTVQVNLPQSVGAAATGRKYLVTGSDFSTLDVTIDSSDIAIQTGMLVKVPQHSVVFIAFTGTDLKLNLPFGFYDPAKGVSVKPGLIRRMGISRVNPSEFAAYDLMGRRITASALSSRRGAGMLSNRMIILRQKQGDRNGKKNLTVR